MDLDYAKIFELSTNDKQERKEFNDKIVKRRRVFADKLKLFVDMLNFHISEYNVDPIVRALADDLRASKNDDMADQLIKVFNNDQEIDQGPSTETDVTDINIESPGTLGIHEESWEYLQQPNREKARLDFLQSLLSSKKLGDKQSEIKKTTKEIVTVINKGLALHKVKFTPAKIGWLYLFYDILPDGTYSPVAKYGYFQTTCNDPIEGVNISEYFIILSYYFISNSHYITTLIYY